jgi:hypothetical protein
MSGTNRDGVIEQPGSEHKKSLLVSPQVRRGLELSSAGVR